MEEKIEAIRAAVAEGATTEQKTSGALACRTLAAALEAQVGKPIVLPGAPAPGPLSGISTDQALDLLIGRLRVVAETREKDTTAAAAAPRNAEPSGLRIAFVQPPPRTQPPPGAAPRVARASNASKPSPKRKP